MSITQKGAATQSQKLMIFVLSMSLYGLATLFTELIPSIQVGIVEFSVEFFLFIPLVLSMLLTRCPRRWERLPGSWCSARSCLVSSAVSASWRSSSQ